LFENHFPPAEFQPAVWASPGMCSEIPTRSGRARLRPSIRVSTFAVCAGKALLDGHNLLFDFSSARLNLQTWLCFPPRQSQPGIVQCTGPSGVTRLSDAQPTASAPYNRYRVGAKTACPGGLLRFLCLFSEGRRTSIRSGGQTNHSFQHCEWSRVLDGLESSRIRTGPTSSFKTAGSDSLV